MNKILYFTAEWCGPCKMMAPTITEAMGGGLPIEKIDVDANQERSIQYNVRSVPTMVLVDGSGAEVKRVMGLQTLTALKDFYNG
jgi:thioredoxin-like negative regulator of GroEL|tara:strand:- start:6241 stop:6492 length:252 start_codon:yes stop_codon:yes gene_type:complete